MSNGVDSIGNIYKEILTHDRFSSDDLLPLVLASAAHYALVSAPVVLDNMRLSFSPDTPAVESPARRSPDCRGELMEGCYLLHFENKLHHAGHYLGYSSCLKARIAAHEAGNSAKLIHAISLKGIRFQVVRLWIDGDRALERRLKNQKNGPKLCPVCQKRVAPGYSIDVKRTVFDKAPPALASHQGQRKPMQTV